MVLTGMLVGNAHPTVYQGFSLSANPVKVISLIALIDTYKSAYLKSAKDNGRGGFSHLIYFSTAHL